MRFSLSCFALVFVVGGALVAGCVADDPITVDDDHLNAAVDPQHPYPKPKVHPPTYPGEPCQVCHRPSSPGEYPPPQPPIPGECTGCHNIQPPNDPHWPMYPPVPKEKKPLKPGMFPIPEFCLRCHFVEPPQPPIPPTPVETEAILAF